LRESLARGDEAGVREHLKEVIGTRVIFPTSGTRTQAATVEAMTGALAKSERLRARDASMTRLSTAIQASDPPAVREAAEEFRAANAPDDSDPRQSFVDQVANWADELPTLAKRNAAHARFQAAQETSDYRISVTAAIDFLRAAPNRIVDARTASIVNGGRASAARWILASTSNLLADDERLIAEFRQLAQETNPIQETSP
jgi:hypothetical protein